MLQFYYECVYRDGMNIACIANVKLLCIQHIHVIQNIQFLL
jgi:hypothetical protein